MRSGWLRTWEPAAVWVSLVVLAWLCWQVVTGGGVVGLDDSISGRVGTVGWPLATAVADLGSPEVSGAVLAVVAVHHAFLSGRWWPLALAAGNGAATGVLVLAVKAATARRGPSGLPLDGYPGYFPSGHTAAAAVCFGTATYVALTTLRGRRPGESRAGVAAGVAAGLAAGLLVGAATVLTGNHWASDVVGALAMAVVVLVLSFALVRRHLLATELSGPRRRLMT